jgi:hypothetical protein
VLNNVGQEEVFNTVGTRIVSDSLNGFNGTNCCNVVRIVAIIENEDIFVGVLSPMPILYKDIFKREHSLRSRLLVEIYFIWNYVCTSLTHTKCIQVFSIRKF